MAFRHIAFVTLLLVVASSAGEPAAEEEKPVPNPEWGRDPLPAKSAEWSPDPEQVQVVYEAADDSVQVLGRENPLHVRAKDNKVIIHPEDDDHSYNAGGDYLKGVEDDKEACCHICPRNKDCDKHGVDGCYSKCHKFCGPQCVVPPVDGDSGEEHSMCTVGVDCGMAGPAMESAISTQDMSANWKEMKSEKSENTPDKPNKKWARPPLAAQGATGAAPTALPVPDEEVHNADVVDATGAAGPAAPGQPLEAGEEGPSTPSEQQAQAAEANAAYAKAQCEAAAQDPCQAQTGCMWCTVATKCMSAEKTCGDEAEETALLQTGTRYLKTVLRGQGA